MCGQIGCVCNNAESTPEGLRGQPTAGALLAAAAKVTHIVQAFVVKMVHHGQASFHTHSVGMSTIVVKVVQYGQASIPAEGYSRLSLADGLQRVCSVAGIE